MVTEEEDEMKNIHKSLVWNTFSHIKNHWAGAIQVTFMFAMLPDVYRAFFLSWLGKIYIVQRSYELL